MPESTGPKGRDAHNAAREPLLDVEGFTFWQEPDGTFQVCVGEPHDFRSATLTEQEATVLMARIRLAISEEAMSAANMEAHTGVRGGESSPAGSQARPTPSAASREQLDNLSARLLGGGVGWEQALAEAENDELSERGTAAIFFVRDLLAEIVRLRDLIDKLTEELNSRG